MSALTNNYETYEKPGLVVNYKLAASKVYKGALLAVNSSGYCDSIAHGTANMKFVGVANESVDNSSGSAGAKSINVTKIGSFVLKAASSYTPVQGDIGKEVYVNTNWEVQVATTGLTNQYKVGTIVALETTSTGATGVRVRIDNYTF